jgi:hypothetical protein
VVSRDDDIEIPPSGLVDVNLAARIVGVKPGTIRQWKNRGHIHIARDTDGTPFVDSQGRQVFDVVEVIEAEYKLRERARRSPLRFQAA